MTAKDTVAVRVARGAVVFRLQRRSALLTSMLWLCALTLAVAALGLGEFDLRLADTLRVLGGGGTLIEYDVVVRDRLPRVVTGLGVGAAFAVSGAILQRIAANPLVSPDVIGVNAGASFGALLVMTVAGGAGASLVLGALAGALLTSAAIVLIALNRGLNGYRLVLVGIGIAAMLSSAISYLLVRADYHQVLSAASWLTGSLANRGTLHVTIVLVALAVAVPVLLVLGRHLRILELGDDLARTLSGGTTRVRLALITTAVVLAAMATAAAGPIGFIALVAPQITRRLLAGRPVTLGPAAAAGALLVTGADLVARLLFAPTELPVGAVTGVLGAPVLLYLLARANRIGHTG
ncbi:MULTISPECIES: FecCD family ABC transporter permease [Prauserella salsuginis group]|uniref:FecCD family ABC transporter permease n=1 Tax=Prauserella salsuginis TaxID=387889 RepID=A0ABW6G9D5_9PSEU|nr:MULTISPECIES: iron chelate uptake ABC transporter family permease subunit [Prauserella salsuginis group]MCR3721528.1 iron complex transport system permease protein [Prauserella flava]MCR3734220.1 iron complex transport system permease protein [Prauserella salsuginis]